MFIHYIYVKNIFGSFHSQVLKNKLNINSFRSLLFHNSRYYKLQVPSHLILFNIICSQKNNYTELNAEISSKVGILINLRSHVITHL